MKKINIGIILIIITLISMICYLIHQENVKKQDIENMKVFLEEYYEVYNKYSVLYEEDREIDKIIDKAKYDEYKENMKNDLDKYIINDSKIKQSIYEQYLTRIDEQIKGKYIYNEHDKVLHDISSDIYFDGDYVILRAKIEFNVDKFDRKIEIYNKDIKKYEGEVNRHTGVERTMEYLVLKKENGNYKIVIHSMFDSKTFLFENAAGGVSLW